MTKSIYTFFVALGLLLLPHYATAQLNNYLNFDGATNFITATSQVAVTNNFTIEFWVKPTGTITLPVQANSGVTGTTGQRYVIYPDVGGGSSAGAGVSVGTNGLCVFEHAAGYLPSLLTWSGTINTWTHIAIAYSNGRPVLYINGVFTQIGAQSNKIVFPTTNGYGGGAYGYYQGDLDELRIWNYELSSANILARKNIELNGNETGLLDYYKFNEGVAGGNNVGITTLIDATTPANNGTLSNNFARSGCASNWLTSVLPSVAIVSDDADNSITTGTSVTFTATPTNGGASPTYQWKKNGANVGTNSDTYTVATLVGSDVITVTMTSSIGCQSPVVSNNILITEAMPIATNYLDFDGANDIITATQQTTVTNNFTMEFWAYPKNTTTLPTPDNPSGAGYGGGLTGQRYVIHPLYGGPHLGGATLVNNYVGAGVSVGTNGVCVSEHGNSYINALLSWSGTISGWTHIAIVYTNKQPSLYINGVLKATGLQSQKTVYVTTTDYGGGSYGYYQGNLDELRIWSTALTPTDILARKNIELNGNEAGLMDYYKFNEGVAGGNNVGITTLTDATSTANTGTLTNFTLNGCASNWLTSALPSVAIVSDDADNSIAAGTSVTFTATPTNGGASPTYQWKKNGGNVGTNSTYTDATLINGDVITVTMTNSVVCNPPAISNNIAVVVVTNNYLNFDGDDNITATQQTTVANNFTMEFWAYPTGTISLPVAAASGTGALSGQRFAIFPTVGVDITGSNDDAGAGVSVGTNGICVTEHGANYISSLLTWTGTITDWTHIAVVYTNKKPSLYINGVLAKTGLQSQKTNVYATTTSYGGGAYGYYQGYLDELRIWDNALSGVTILANKDIELTGTEAGLLDYYKFNQGVAGGNNAGVTTLIDATTPANNGTLNSFALTGCTSNWITQTVSPASVTIVSDDVDNSIQYGTSLTFTATPTNGGTPSYQWKKNGSNVGANSATYTNATLNNGDEINVVMTSSLGCQLPVSSNSIQVNVGYTYNYLNFDGADDVITATQQTTVTNNFTMEFWANPTGTITLPTAATSGTNASSGQRFVIYPNEGTGSDAGAGISVGTNGVCVVENGDGYTSSLLTWAGTITGWTHIAVVYTNKQPSLYINGVLATTGLTSIKNNVYVSTNSYGGGQYGYYQGDLDELRIWDNTVCEGNILVKKDNELKGTEPGLIDYYKFNQGTGSGTNTGVIMLTDATTTANNGTLHNFTLTGTASNWLDVAPSPVSLLVYSIVGHSYLNFDGVNDKITAAQQATVANNFTMEFWAKPTGTITLYTQSTSGAPGTVGQRFAIFPTVGVDITGSNNDAGAGVSVGTNGICVTEHGAGYLPSLLTWTGTITDWTHIAVVYTNKQPSLYINGVLVATTGLTSTKANVFATTTGYGGGTFGYFQGDLDELRIWDNALSAATILANKDIELTGNEAGLIDYYKFNEGNLSGNNTGVTTLTDATTTTNNGMLNNFALTGSSSNWVADGIVAPTASVTILSNSPYNIIDAGTSVTFTATPTNGGASPSYQWKKNGLPVGTNNTYTDATLVSNDQIIVEMTSTISCPQLATSNSIVMGITSPSALDFNGVNHYAVLPSNFDATFSTGEMTVAVWIYIDNYVLLGSILKNWWNSCQGYHFGQDQYASGKLGITIRQTNGATPAVVSNTSIPLSQWVHVAFVADGTNLILYQDGVEVGITPYDGTIFQCSNAPVIACKNTGSSLNSFWDGKLDELQIWNKGLTLSEINNLSNKTITNPASVSACLSAYYRMDEGTGTGLTDNSTNGANITLMSTNGTYASWATGTTGITSTTTLTSCSVPLPVELIYFDAAPKEDNVELTWQTASEENNEGFDIERSADGKNWETLGFVKGNGTTVEVFNYNFIDKNPINGINYYRLKQMDFDGQFEYSKIVNVNLFSTNNTITIYPNPVRDELTVTNTENVENVVIYNALGQVVKQFAVNAEQLKINVSDLQEGIYTLRLQNKNGTMITKQFVK